MSKFDSLGSTIFVFIFLGIVSFLLVFGAELIGYPLDVLSSPQPTRTIIAVFVLLTCGALAGAWLRASAQADSLDESRELLVKVLKAVDGPSHRVREFLIVLGETPAIEDPRSTNAFRAIQELGAYPRPVEVMLELCEAEEQAADQSP